MQIVLHTIDKIYFSTSCALKYFRAIPIAMMTLAAYQRADCFDQAQAPYGTKVNSLPNSIHAFTSPVSCVLRAATAVASHTRGWPTLLGAISRIISLAHPRPLTADHGELRALCGGRHHLRMC